MSYLVPGVDSATYRLPPAVEAALATEVVAPAAAAAASGVAAGKADTASPTFTGTVTVPTPTASGAAANKSYVDSSAATKVDENALIYNAKKAGTGIKGDRMAVFTGAMTSGSAALTISGVSFTSADVGKTAIVAGAGAAGATLRTTIAAFVSSTQVTLAAAASTTVSAKYTAWGTDDTAALQAAIDAMTTTSSNVVRGGEVLIPQRSRCMITDTIYVRRAGGRLKGVGFSDWASGYSSLPYGSMLIWDGPSGKPMIQVESAKFFRLEGLSLIGNPTADCRPSALLRFYTPDSSTTNGQPAIENCVIGRVATYGGFAGSNAERVADAGILFDGANSQNDRFRIVGGRVEGCTIGLSLPNTQSVLGSVDGTTFFRNDTHVSTAAQVHLRSVYLGNSAVRDLDISSTARVKVSDVGSEISAQFARMRGASTLIVEGGYFQCTSSLNVDKVIIDAVDNTRQTIRLKDLQIDSATGWTVTTAPILVRAHAASDSSLSNKQVEVDGVRYPNSTNIGITPSFFDVTPVGTAESVTVWGHVQPAGGGNQNEGVEQSFYNILRSPSDTLNFSRDDRLPVSLTEEFTASGTWTKPPGAKTVEVICIGPGAGGGSGRRGASGTVCGGGGGGAGGAVVRATFDAADLGSTESVTIPTGGAGGAAVTADNTNGNIGSLGSSSTQFGSSSSRRVVAPPGYGTSPGGGGTTSGGAAGISPYTLATNSQMSSGAAGGSTGAGTGVNASVIGPAGGPGGGGISGTPAAFAGGAGSYSCLSGGAGGSGGVVDSTAPGTGTAPTQKGAPGQSGGGGAASITTAAQAGASATGYGAGGAGGGASLNGNNSGAGGAGGPGYCLVVTRF